MAGSRPPAPAANSGHARYVVLRDRDGRRHAVAKRAVSLVYEIEDGGCTLLLPGGHVVVLAEDLDTVLEQLA